MITVNNMVTLNNIPVTIAEVEYDPKHKKRSHKWRKKQTPPLLECGNAAIVFKLPYTETLWQYVLDWHSVSESVYEDGFNFEAVCNYNTSIIELRYCSSKSFYIPRNIHSNSVLDDVEGNVSETLKLIPEGFSELITEIVISDWDYLEYIEDEEV